MSYCASCGAEYQGSPKFCSSCGARITTPEPQVSAEFVPEQPVDSNPQPAYVPPTYSAGPENPGYTQPDYSRASYQQQTPYGGTPTSQGILKLAWDDVKNAADLVPRLLILALLSCVPVLNFAATGYTLRWGRRAAFRTGDPLPSDFFGDRAFVTGFFVAVIALVYGLVFGILSAIPLVGVVIALFMVVPVELSVMHMAMVDQLGAGFRLGDMWEKIKSDVGGLLVIGYVPSLIAAAVVIVVLGVASTACGVSILAVAAAANNPDALLGGMSLFGILVFIVAMYVSMVVSVMASLVTYRAMGYWVSRFAPDWVQESVQVGASPL